jgi:hypothetical protein
MIRELKWANPRRIGASEPDEIDYFPGRGNRRSMVMPPRATSADKTIKHKITDVACRAIGSDAVRDSGHLSDEVDQAQVEKILDQSETRDANPRVGAVPDLGERVIGRFLGGRVDEYDLATFEVSGRLAIGDHNDLLVRGRLPRQHAARQSQTCVDVREVLRDSAGRMIEVESEIDPAVVHTDRFRSRVQ